MLEQQQTSAEQHSRYVPKPNASNGATPALTPRADALLAAYVARTEAAQQDATRQRLHELAAAHLELDAPPEQAAHAAIQHMEDERTATERQRITAQQQAFVQRKRTRSAKQSARPATLTALKVFGPGAMAMISCSVGVNMWLRHGHHSSANYEILNWLVLALVFVLPALLGAGVGARSKHRPMLGTFSAIALLIPLMSFVGASVFAVLPFYQSWGQSFCFLAAVLALFWLPIGVTAAGLTGWGRDALRRKRRRDAVTLS